MQEQVYGPEARYLHLRCTRCKTTKHRSEFATHRARSTGKAKVCKPCDREKSRDYYERNKDRIKARYALQQRERREQLAKVGGLPTDKGRPRRRVPIPCLICGEPHNRSKYCAACAVELDRQRARLRKIDAEENRIRCMKRRAAMRYTDVDANWLVDLKAKIKKCQLCNVKLTHIPNQSNSRQVDHIVPLAAGGTHAKDNLRILCRTCNLTRPFDGSDLAGVQVALTQVDVAAIPNVRDATATGRSPDRAKARNDKRVARGLARALSETSRASLGVTIARVRATGAHWEEIAALVPWSDNTGTAWALAAKHAELPEIAGRQGRPRRAA